MAYAQNFFRLTAEIARDVGYRQIIRIPPHYMPVWSSICKHGDDA